jgi:transposase InsO family protein
MPWDTKDKTERRKEFIAMLEVQKDHFARLCRVFGISRKTGYKWRARFLEGGGLDDLTPRPARRSNQTPEATERALLEVRAEFPFWGPRKLCKLLEQRGAAAPSRSSAARILKRNGCVAPEDSRARTPFVRFERARPNELWQMDFKGHFPLADARRCHPLTLLDDHSRYLVGLFACADEQAATVQAALQHCFALHGLPAAILCDHGSPWCAPEGGHSRLCVWLLQLGIRVLHGRPRHPQTQGKDERFHRTLKAELLDRHDWPDLPSTQKRFDAYRRLYNHQRPHEALALAVPATRYQPSLRPLPASLPAIHYAPGELTRTVKSKGEITFKNRFYYIGRAFIGQSLALRPLAQTGLFNVCFGPHCLGSLSITASSNLPKGLYHPLCPPVS